MLRWTCLSAASPANEGVRVVAKASVSFYEICLEIRELLAMNPDGIMMGLACVK